MPLTCPSIKASQHVCVFFYISQKNLLSSLFIEILREERKKRKKNIQKISLFPGCRRQINTHAHIYFMYILKNILYKRWHTETNRHMMGREKRKDLNASTGVFVHQEKELEGGERERERKRLISSVDLHFRHKGSFGKRIEWELSANRCPTERNRQQRGKVTLRTQVEGNGTMFVWNDPNRNRDEISPRRKWRVMGHVRHSMGANDDDEQTRIDPGSRR